jgi:PPOX class probable F420-dependent enzyme
MTAIPTDVLDLLRGPCLCYIATTMPNGSPQLTQVWADTDGEHVVLNIVEDSQKERNLRRDPRVALAVSDPANPHHYVQIRGSVVEMTTEGGSDHIEALSQKYTGGPYAWWGGRDTVRVRVLIEARRIAGSGGQRRGSRGNASATDIVASR